MPGFRFQKLAVAYQEVRHAVARLPSIARRAQSRVVAVAFPQRPERARAHRHERPGGGAARRLLLGDRNWYRPRRLSRLRFRVGK